MIQSLLVSDHNGSDSKSLQRGGWQVKALIGVCSSRRTRQLSTHLERYADTGELGGDTIYLRS